MDERRWNLVGRPRIDGLTDSITFLQRENQYGVRSIIYQEHALAKCNGPNWSISVSSHELGATLETIHPRIASSVILYSTKTNTKQQEPGGAAQGKGSLEAGPAE